MAKQIKLDDLDPEVLKALKAQVKDEMQEETEKVRENRKAYKALVNETLPICFNVLKSISKALADGKKYVFDNLEGLVKMKGDVYDREQDQHSHSFTTDEGITIIIGHRHLDGWDDTVDVGIQKVTDYIQSLGKDANSKALVKTVLQLLSRDKSGNLKASRVLQLKKLADDAGDAGFKDAIQIIQDSYRPSKSKQFITCRYKDEKGEMVELALNITDVEIPQPQNN